MRMCVFLFCKYVGRRFVSLHLPCCVASLIQIFSVSGDTSGEIASEALQSCDPASFGRRASLHGESCFLVVVLHILAVARQTAFSASPQVLEWHAIIPAHVVRCTESHIIWLVTTPLLLQPERSSHRRADTTFPAP